MHMGVCVCGRLKCETMGFFLSVDMTTMSVMAACGLLEGCELIKSIDRRAAYTRRLSGLLEFLRDTRPTESGDIGHSEIGKSVILSRRQRVRHFAPFGLKKEIKMTL